MRFWDSSALVPICLEEAASPALRDLLRTGGRPAGEGFVSLDLRLREAARMEGFHLLPTL